MTAAARPETAIAIQSLQFAYGTGPCVIDIPALEIRRGNRVFLHGPSGCGKTTLLGILAGVLHATRGSVRVLDRDLIVRASPGIFRRLMVPGLGFGDLFRVASLEASSAERRFGCSSTGRLLALACIK